VKTKLLLLIVVAAVVWGLKRHYSDAGADDLWWILGPTARLVEMTTGTAFTMAPGEGYVSHERLFVIEKACAGINFMAAAFGMLALGLVHRVRSAVSLGGVIAVSLIAGYGAATLVNAARIALALWLAAHPMTLSTLTAADIHRFEGIAVYFGGLVVLYELARRVDRSVLLARCGR
jgi:exosortase K